MASLGPLSGGMKKYFRPSLSTVAWPETAPASSAVMISGVTRSVLLIWMGPAGLVIPAHAHGVTWNLTACPPKPCTCLLRDEGSPSPAGPRASPSRHQGSP